jgi:hypothetical protein
MEKKGRKVSKSMTSCLPGHYGTAKDVIIKHPGNDTASRAEQKTTTLVVKQSSEKDME